MSLDTFDEGGASQQEPIDVCLLYIHRHSILVATIHRQDGRAVKALVRIGNNVQAKIESNHLQDSSFLSLSKPIRYDF